MTDVICMELALPLIAATTTVAEPPDRGKTRY